MTNTKPHQASLLRCVLCITQLVWPFISAIGNAPHHDCTHACSHRKLSRRGHVSFHQAFTRAVHAVCIRCGAPTGAMLLPSHPSRPAWHAWDSPMQTSCCCTAQVSTCFPVLNAQSMLRCKWLAGRWTLSGSMWHQSFVDVSSGYQFALVIPSLH